jgi:aldehyde dehydrogenase (NAD+)
VRDEIFGPVTSVLKFSEIDEAIAIANNSEYGLVGGVFSADQIKTHKVVGEMQCGAVYVNNWFNMFYDAPFGGYKQSGFGREMGEEGIESFLETKSVIYDCN